MFSAARDRFGLSISASKADVLPLHHRAVAKSKNRCEYANFLIADFLIDIITFQDIIYNIYNIAGTKVNLDELNL